MNKSNTESCKFTCKLWELTLKSFEIEGYLQENRYFFGLVFHEEGKVNVALHPCGKTDTIEKSP